MLQRHRLTKHLPIARIAIVRSLPGLGDLLCAVPAMRALRAAFPQSQITLIGLAWARAFVERFSHYLDDFLEFPGYPGIPEVSPPVHKLPEFFANVQQQRFDLALQMHGSGIVSNSFTVLLGARVNAGFYLPGYYCPDPDYFLPYPVEEPEVWRHLRLMDYLGIVLQGEELEFPLWEEDFSGLQMQCGFLEERTAFSTRGSANAQRLRQEKKPWRSLSARRRTPRENMKFFGGKYVCVHPGASVPERCWSLQNFAVVADAIAARGLQVVFTGTAGEAHLTRAIAEMMRFKSIDLAGRTSLGALAAVLSNAALLVCNDTGVSHLAAALQVKSVVIFTNSEMNRWAPLDRDRHRIISASSYSALNMVMAEVDKLLGKEVVNVT